MLKYRNFGRKSLKEIQDILGEMGLHFGMDVSQYKLEREDRGGVGGPSGRRHETTDVDP